MQQTEVMFLLLQNSYLSSVIGTPTKEEWPSESAITPDQFVSYSQKPWLQLLPEACQQAQNLLSVSLHFDWL